MFRQYPFVIAILVLVTLFNLASRRDRATAPPPTGPAPGPAAGPGWSCGPGAFDKVLFRTLMTPPAEVQRITPDFARALAERVARNDDSDAGAPERLPSAVAGAGPAALPFTPDALKCLGRFFPTPPTTPDQASISGPPADTLLPFPRGRDLRQCLSPCHGGGG